MCFDMIAGRLGDLPSDYTADAPHLETSLSRLCIGEKQIFI